MYTHICMRTHTYIYIQLQYIATQLQQSGQQNPDDDSNSTSKFVANSYLFPCFVIMCNYKQRQALCLLSFLPSFLSFEYPA